MKLAAAATTPTTRTGGTTVTTLPRRVHPGRLAVLGLAIATLAGCGTHVGHDAIVTAANGAAVNAQASSPSGEGATPEASGTGGNATGAPQAGTTGANTGVAGTSGSAATTGAPQAGTTGGSTSGGSATGGSGTAAASTPCTKQLAPVVLGQTLAASGLVGAAISNMRNGLAVWAQDVNSRGGVECHPVKIFQEDDGSDPSRVSSNFNDLVNNKHAVAIVGAGVPVAIGALRSSAEKAKIPVIGGDIIATDWHESPYLFPQGGTAVAGYQGATVEAAQSTKGAKVAGLIYCVEASACTAIKNTFPGGAKKGGLAAGPVKAMSLTQSDYTAECQAMKDGGAQVVFLAADGSASTRIARNCASLGYRPTFATAGIAVSAQASGDANLRQNHLFLGGTVAPFMMSDTPGGAAFHVALNKFGGGQPVDQSTIQGWSSGKLFEAALAKVSARARAGNITTQMILDGLWQLKNETLAGLAPGVSFNKGTHATVVSCYYAIRLDQNGFSAPKKSVKQCIGP